jgi:hypothetical protein
MNHAAVAAALMLPDARFFLKHEQPKMRKPPCDFERNRQPDDPCANYRDVVASVTHGENQYGENQSWLSRPLHWFIALVHCTMSVTEAPFGWLMLAGEPITVTV